MSIDRRQSLMDTCPSDDQAELLHYRRRLAAVEAKRDAATDEADRCYYATCAAGWRRSIEKLEREIEEQNA